MFLDLSKAFDTINHELLYAKLEHYGVRCTALNWFKSYLTGRKIRSKCQISSSGTVHYSDYHDINIGTPQGSCLGPLIFLIFRNDLCLNLEFCNTILFADDTTIYKSHRNLEYLKWCIIHDMTLLCDWFKANQLSLNGSKSVGMLFSKTKNNIHSMKVGNIDIKFVDQIRKQKWQWETCLLNVTHIQCQLMKTLCQHRNSYLSFPLIHHAWRLSVFKKWWS